MTGDCLPDPLTPPGCDLRGLPYMPLSTARFCDSDLIALSTGDEFKAAVMLLCKAWQQVPAASLPDDDRILAHLSGAGSSWTQVKPVALRGWVRCRDGRLYHPVLAEMAGKAWQGRLAKRAGGAKGNAARWGSHEDRYSNPNSDLHPDPNSDLHPDRKYKGKLKNNDSLTSSPAASDEREVDLLSDPPSPAMKVGRAPTGPQDALTEAAAIWNEHAAGAGLPQVSKLTEVRQRRLRKLLADELGSDLERWRGYISAIGRSPFLTGQGPRGWRADIDWALKPDNLVAVREGKYGTGAA